MTKGIYCIANASHASNEKAQNYYVGQRLLFLDILAPKLVL